MGFENLAEITTLQELANFLKISEITIRRAIKKEELKATKIGKDYRFEKENVLKWLKKEKENMNKKIKKITIGQSPEGKTLHLYESDYENITLPYNLILINWNKFVKKGFFKTEEEAKKTIKEYREKLEKENINTLIL